MENRAENTGINPEITFTFAGHIMQCVAEFALYWPEKHAIFIADMHMEKSHYLAQGGQFLPPGDSRMTLEKLIHICARHYVKTIYCLGDNFHHQHAMFFSDSHAEKLLRQLSSQYEMVWLTGNHDPVMPRKFGGIVAEDIVLGDILLSHIARPQSAIAQGIKGEITGHFHPCFTIKTRAGKRRKKCFLLAKNLTAKGEHIERLILPGFGSLTGSLDTQHPEIMAVFDGNSAIFALIVQENRLYRFAVNKMAQNALFSQKPYFIE